MARQGRHLSEQEIKRIVTLLASSDMTILEIAQRMTCSRGTIAAINRKFQVRKYAGPKSKWILTRMQ
jgi:IS30 family transposase